MHCKYYVYHCVLVCIKLFTQLSELKLQRDGYGHSPSRKPCAL